MKGHAILMLFSWTSCICLQYVHCSWKDSVTNSCVSLQFFWKHKTRLFLQDSDIIYIRVLYLVTNREWVVEVCFKSSIWITLDFSSKTLDNHSLRRPDCGVSGPVIRVSVTIMRPINTRHRVMALTSAGYWFVKQFSGSEHDNPM